MTDPIKKALEAFGTASDEARTSPELTTELVTPEMAQRWLDSYNTENRKVKKTALDRYVRDIENGDWTFLGDPIRFDVRGILIDGQHRLMAIVKSGQSVMMAVLRGIPTEARATIDSGARRSSGDALQIEGYKNATTLASTVAALDAYRKGLFVHAGSSPTYSPSHSEVLNLVHEYAPLGIEEHVAAGASDYGHVKLHPTVIAMSRFLQRRVASQEEVDEFWYGVCYTAGPGDARWSLRNWANRVGQNKARKGSRRDTSLRLFAVSVCWNAWREGRNTRIVSVASKEVYDDEGNVVKPTVYRDIPEMM